MKNNIKIMACKIALFSYSLQAKGKGSKIDPF